MRRSLIALVAVALLAAGLVSTFRAHDARAQAPSGQSAPPVRVPGGPPPADSGRRGPPPPYEWNPARAETTIAMMIDHIKGKEDMPAESVYKNIKIFKGLPAKRIPSIMVKGFSRSLGMRCGGCHVRDDFASDDKPEKRIARAMYGMEQDINKNELAAIKDLEVDMPMVNCWTCHRGHHEPETDADHASVDHGPDAHGSAPQGQPGQKPETQH